MIQARFKVNAKEVYKKEIFGKGVVIAIIDSGIYPHVDLRPRILYHINFTGNTNNIRDEFGHGTHVAGIASGNGRLSQGRYCGIAPLSEVISIKVLDAEGKGDSYHTCRALEWILQNHIKWKIRIVNFSMGFMENTPAGNEKKIMDLIEKLWDAGIVVVAAAGNNGPKCGTITVPGVSRKIITVGCIEEDAKSGRGPTKEGIVKPELYAPGKGIVSLSAKGNYSQKTGSSMATPMVSGAIALALSCSPQLKPWELKQLLYHTCQKNKEDSGWGVLDVDNLIKIL